MNYIQLIIGRLSFDNDFIVVFFVFFLFFLNFIIVLYFIKYTLDWARAKKWLPIEARKDLDNFFFYEVNGLKYKVKKKVLSQ